MKQGSSEQEYVWLSSFIKYLKLNAIPYRKMALTLKANLFGLWAMQASIAIRWPLNCILVSPRSLGYTFEEETRRGKFGIRDYMVRVGPRLLVKGGAGESKYAREVRMSEGYLFANLL